MTTKRVYIGIDNRGADEKELALRADRVTSAIRSAVDWGASRITVADSGGLPGELLPPDALYIRTPLPWGGLDDSFTAALLFGPPDEAPGWAARGIAQVCLNGVCVESPGLLCALMAGGRGIPVAAAVGCDDYTAAIRGIAPEVEAVILQSTLPDGSIRHAHPSRSERAVGDGVMRGLRRIEAIQPVCLHAPIRCEVDFIWAGGARRAALIPGVTLTAARSVAFAGGYAEIEPILALVLCYLDISL